MSIEAIQMIAKAQERTEKESQNQSKNSSKALSQSNDTRSQQGGVEQQQQQHGSNEESKSIIMPEAPAPKKVYNPDEFKNTGMDSVPTLSPVFRNQIIKNLVEQILSDYKTNKQQKEKWKKFANWCAFYLEKELDSKFKSSTPEYRNEVRAISHMIELKGNILLRKNLLEGKINLRHFIDDRDEFLDKKLKEKQEEQNKRFRDEADPEFESKFVKESQQYQCEKCGSKKILVTERQLKATDHPMTIFYDCVDCKYHWEEGD